MLPELTSRPERGHRAPVLVWRLPAPELAISSGPLGGGIGSRGWVLNASVPMSYDRYDPDVHLTEIAAGLGLAGPGVGLLTGVDVADRATGRDDGVLAVATVGLGVPTWAADGPAAPGHPGTINIVARIPTRLSAAALVNAVTTVAEAKAQALWDLKVPATGTASDATCVLCPIEGPEELYGGPRSRWGARLARSVHGAVLAGGRAWLDDRRAWLDDRPPRRSVVPPT